MWFITRLFKRIFGPTLELKADDIVVFVVGPTGGGKSGFIKAVTESHHIEVGKDLKPCTTKVQAIRCELKDEARSGLRASEKQKYIVFVDTPSFHTDLGKDERAKEEMSRWLRESKSKSTLVGTIYVDRVANVPSFEPTTIQKHLDSFASTFWSLQHFTFSPRLRGVLSYDSEADKIKEDEIVSRRDTFQQQLRTVRSSQFQAERRLKWDTSCHPECLRRDKPQEAWNAVVALFSQSRLTEVSNRND